MAQTTQKPQTSPEAGMSDDLSVEEAAALVAYMCWGIGEGPMPPMEKWKYYSAEAQAELRAAMQAEQQKRP